MPFVKTKVSVEGHETEVLTELPEHEAPFWGEGTQLNVVGKPIPRIEGKERITGKAMFTFDITLPDMLYGKMLRSPHAHAKVKKIDDSEAKNIKGYIGIIHSQNSNPISIAGGDFLFNPEVHFAGDEVAIVIAETERAARDARETIKVEYEVLPFVVDKMKALEKGAPIASNPEGNLVNGEPKIKIRGNIDDGFAQADTIIEATITIPNVHHSCLETHGSVAKWDEDQLTVYDSSQSVNRVQGSLASTFKLPSSKVQVIMEYMGGGFGSKTGCGKYTIAAVLASKTFGKPVKVFLDRDEEFLATGHRSADIQKIKIGAKKDGTLTAIYLQGWVDTGAFVGRFIDVSAPAHQMYLCPNVKSEMYGVYLNTETQCAMRGPAATEGMFSLETAMDLLATKLNMDPIDLRNKNDTMIGDQVKGLKYASKAQRECYEWAAKQIDWKNKRNPSPGQGQTGTIKRGVGIGSLIWGAGGGPPSSADVYVYPDGSANVRAPFNDLGQGARTAMAQIAAETLGLTIDKVTISAADTRGSGYDAGSYGSRLTSSMGPAVHNAAWDAVLQIAKAVAVKFSIPEDEVVYENGVYYTPNKDNSVTLVDIMESYNRPVVGNGFRGPNNPQWVFDSFGAHAIEVEVNTETGEIKILNFAAAHDAGRVINPLLIMSQMYGAIATGIGFGLYEKQVIDPQLGIPVTTDFMSYKLPTYADYPQVEPYIVPQIDPNNNIGTKGFAEPPCMPTAPALANAVYNATGVLITDLPMTPDKILNALAKKK